MCSAGPIREALKHVLVSVKIDVFPRDALDSVASAVDDVVPRDALCDALRAGDGQPCDLDVHLFVRPRGSQEALARDVREGTQRAA